MDIKEWLRNTTRTQLCYKRESSHGVLHSSESVVSRRWDKSNLSSSGKSTLGSPQIVNQSHTQKFAIENDVPKERGGGSSSLILGEEEGNLSAGGPNEHFEKRKRCKTRSNLYEPHGGERSRRIGPKEERTPKRASKHHKTHRKKRKKLRQDIASSYYANNVGENRLTLRQTPNVGLFNRGLASVPQATRGLPDLMFSEMRFLSNPDKSRAEPVAGGPKDRKKSQQMAENRTRHKIVSGSYSATSPEPEQSRRDRSIGGVPSSQRHPITLDGKHQFVAQPITKPNGSPTQLKVGRRNVSETRSNYADGALPLRDSDKRGASSSSSPLEPREMPFQTSATVHVGQLGKHQSLEDGLCSAPCKSALLPASRHHHQSAANLAFVPAPNVDVQCATSVGRQQSPGGPSTIQPERVAETFPARPVHAGSSAPDASSAVSRLLQDCKDALGSMHEQTNENEQEHTFLHGPFPMEASFLESQCTSRWQKIDNRAVESEEKKIERSIRTPGYSVRWEGSAKHKTDFESMDDNYRSSWPRINHSYAAGDCTTPTVSKYLEHSALDSMQPGMVASDDLVCNRYSLSNPEMRNYKRLNGDSGLQQLKFLHYSSQNAGAIVEMDEQKCYSGSTGSESKARNLDGEVERRAWMLNDNWFGDEGGRSMLPADFWRPNKL